MSDPTPRLTYRDGEHERNWLATANSELRSMILRLRTLLDELDALHVPFDYYGDMVCHECFRTWPCRTHRLLHPEETDDE